MRKANRTSNGTELPKHAVTVNVVPNYASVLAWGFGLARTELQTLADNQDRGQGLEYLAAHNVAAALNIALQAVDSVQALDKLRADLHALVNRLPKPDRDLSE